MTDSTWAVFAMCQFPWCLSYVNELGVSRSGSLFAMDLAHPSVTISLRPTEAERGFRAAGTEVLRGLAAENTESGRTVSHRLCSTDAKAVS